jgi:transposase
MSICDVDLKVCFYDITSTYFESDHIDNTDDIRRFGYSRDHRSDRCQVLIGVVMTEEGIPLAHYVFDGNTADRSTLKEVISDIKARFGTHISVTPVVDKGMISKNNLAWLLSQEFTFTIGESKNISLTSRDVINEANEKYLNKDRPHTFEKEVLYNYNVTDDNGNITGETSTYIRYIASFNPDTYKLNMECFKVRISDFEEEVCRINTKKISINNKYAQIVSYAVRKHIKGLYDIVVKDNKVVVTKKQDKFEYIQKSFGWFIVKSNLNKLEYSSEHIIETYKGLWRVEHGFRELKHTIEVRPMYHLFFASRNSPILQKLFPYPGEEFFLLTSACLNRQLSPWNINK